MSAIIIAKFIYSLQISNEMKSKLTACVFYNQSKLERVNLQKRLKLCLKKYQIKSAI